MKSMLIYGATGKAGRLVLERAVEAGYVVSAFVRNPDKVPAALRARVTIVKGDLSDAAAVSAAVRSPRPHVIVDASSALPFGHARGQPANSADRAVVTRATVDALQAEGRLGDCVLLIVGGQLIPEPGGTIHPSEAASGEEACTTIREGRASVSRNALEGWSATRPASQLQPEPSPIVFCPPHVLLSCSAMGLAVRLLPMTKPRRPGRSPTSPSVSRTPFLCPSTRSQHDPRSMAAKNS